MATGVGLAKQAVHDKFESQIKAAEAKLGTLKAQAESTGERRTQGNRRTADNEAGNSTEAS